ncbi:hypothetical protein PHISP_06970 [Aspergillus sp. HF37]|nr:hypothetical protein PHISP_06970 [Aspergillus sp. HF37]
MSDFVPPQTVEVDLIFPRNETYALSPLMPVVFAVQNPFYAEPLDLSLSYRIFDVSTWNDSTSNILEPKWSNITTTSNDPYYFVFDGTQKFSDIEGTWMLLWEVHGLICSESHSTFTIRGINDANKVWFTTKKGAQQADLIAATDPGTCANTQSFTFNVTGSMDISTSSQFDADSCAVLSPTSPWPAPSQCQVEISSAKASSINDYEPVRRGTCGVLNVSIDREVKLSITVKSPFSNNRLLKDTHPPEVKL